MLPVWIAFQRLSRSRPAGMDAGSIQIEAVTAYFALIGLEDLECRDAWLDMIQEMDRAWMKHRAASRSDEEGKTPE